ncbi:murein biosynthesis integral membrane protein MurJ [Synoicihabitans lomoniglobus]|uniref:Probable lipid II flippase MurJ n=1 Tax=Synoicihabitans lomoniglobus TaxID=2909285 RepID=A0AAF0I6N9_9BACT|nr:murein biosynthesis integral membrane protein MurJ [Opitutaceae bacterium LMO-M01]WED66196.1 murein biosynthesis integral membrane protein MurJ [Opitutaceae bacterium LMO-M01]
MSRSLKNIGIVSAATMLSRVLGLGRDMLVTTVFGAGPLASAFVTAFTLPNLFRRLLGEGALTAALVPTLNDELAQRQRSGAFVLVNQVASWLGAVTLVIVALAMVSLAGLAEAGWLETWSGKPAQVARWREAAELAVVLFPYLVFVCLSAAFSAALQTLDRFLEPALSPIWLNLAMIGMLGGAVWWGDVTLDDARMRWLCGGVLIGGFLQMVVPAVALMTEGWRPRPDFSLSPAVKSMLVLMGPTVLGSAVYLINLSVSRIIGLSLNDSAAAILNLATRLIELPIGVFAIAVSTVVFPLISRYAAKGDWPNLARSYHRGMRLVLAINVPAAVGMVVLAAPIIRVLFQRGEFRPEDTLATVPVLMVFAAGLPVFAYVNLMLRAFYAQKDTRTPVRAAVMSFVVNVSLSLALMGPLSTMGLALASNVAVVAQAVYLQRALTRQRAELGVGPMVVNTVKILIASVGMGLAVGAGARLFATMPTTWAWDLARLAVLVPVGIAVYGGLVWFLRLEGREEIAALLRGRRPIAPGSKNS